MCAITGDMPGRAHGVIGLRQSTLASVQVPTESDVRALPADQERRPIQLHGACNYLMVMLAEAERRFEFN